MKKLLLTTLVTLGLAGCGSQMTTTDAGTNTENDAGVDAGPTALDFSSGGMIMAHLEGKTMLMTGTDIPSHPNGYDEDKNYGSATQCYKQVKIATLGGQFNVTSDLGTLASSAGADGGTVTTCDHSTSTQQAAFTSTAVLIENVKNNGECFDITSTYVGFKQEGRGMISADGKTVTLELFFSATGHRCADGAVGGSGVTLVNSVGQFPFSGDAKQVYRVQ